MRVWDFGLCVGFWGAIWKRDDLGQLRRIRGIGLRGYEGMFQRPILGTARAIHKRCRVNVYTTILLPDTKGKGPLTFENSEL